MSETEILAEFDKLPFEKQKQLFARIAEKIIATQAPDSKPWLGKQLSFDQACDVVFRENRELFAVLAQ